MQLTGDPGCVPPDVRIEFSFALIEPQLASGRISVTAKVFEVSLPVSFRGLFQAGPGAVDVALPLQEVLKNLPATSLRMRDDQEEQDAGENFATPFRPRRKRTRSVMCRQRRWRNRWCRRKLFAIEFVQLDAGTCRCERTQWRRDSDGYRRRLRSSAALLGGADTDEKLDAKGVVALVNKIPGVKACLIPFATAWPRGQPLASWRPTAFALWRRR